MKKILLPIKPVYVNRILNQTKTYEFRKKICKKQIDKIIIYATSPVKKVVGEVEVLEILENTPSNLWQKTQNYAGTTKEKFMNYFKNSDIAYAYKLGNVTIYENPKDLSDFNINYYPQSFVYLEK